MSWSTPITNRTKHDVAEVKRLLSIPWTQMTLDEQTAYINGLKGAFNLSDAQRIKGNIKVLSDTLELGLIDYDIPEDYPTTTWVNNILTEVEAIRKAYTIYDSTPKTPKKITTYSELNAVEQILSDVYSIIRANFILYTGETYAGETTGLPIGG